MSYFHDVQRTTTILSRQEITQKDIAPPISQLLYLYSNCEFAKGAFCQDAGVEPVQLGRRISRFQRRFGVFSQLQAIEEHFAAQVSGVSLGNSFLHKLESGATAACDSPAQFEWRSEKSQSSASVISLQSSPVDPQDTPRKHQLTES
jgi:hypothetical protein